jgi:hypothetical protein
MKKFLEKYPVFLLLLPLFVVLHIEKENHEVIIYRFVYGEIIFLFVTPIVCYGLSFLITRNIRKAGLVTALLLVFFYFFGELKETLKWYFRDSIWQSYTVLLPLSLVLLVAAIIFIRRSPSKFFRAYLFINTLLLLFILADLVPILFLDQNKEDRQNNTPALAVDCGDCVKPDIYYIVLDGYSSSRALKEHFHFDNSAVDSSLTAKGFRIIYGSRSNYNLTPFSIGSQFNFNYLPHLDTSKEFFMRRYLPAIMKVYHSPLLPMMQQLGYTVYNHSVFNFNSFPSTVPEYDMWKMAWLYQQYNFIKKIDRDIGWNFPNLPHLINRNTLYTYAYNRDRHDSITLAHLTKTIQAQDAKPKFVYGHLIIPHSPYTFDSSGQKIPAIPLLSPQKDMQAYVGQVGHVNKIMASLVDQVFAAQKRPFIIILQGDHGYRFANPDKNNFEFPNLSAFYFYNRDYRLLHDSMTNINTFPVIFNTFFKQQLPMRPDHFYFLKYK